VVAAGDFGRWHPHNDEIAEKDLFISGQEIIQGEINSVNLYKF
jgi:hypothetical protein